VSIITNSFDKIRHDAKDHPEKYDADIFKYLSEKWRELRFKKDSKRRSTVLTHENYVDYLASFHIQTNRLIAFLAAVIFIFILKFVFICVIKLVGYFPSISG